MGEEFKGGIINSVVCTSEAVEKIIMAVFPGIKKKNQNWLIGSSGLVIKLLSAFF